MRRGVALAAVAGAVTALELAMRGSPMLVAAAMVLMAVALAAATWAGPPLTARRMFTAAGTATSWALACAAGVPDSPAGIPVAVLMLATTWLLSRDWPGRASAAAST